MQVLPEELKKFARLCPDFVMEVRSESDNLSELQQKMGKWIQNGVRLGWLIDPQTQTTTIYRADQEPENQSFTAFLSGEGVLVGFTMNVAQVLAQV